MTSKEITQKVIDLVNANGGCYVFDTVKDKELIDNIDIPVRSALAKEHKIMVKHDTVTKLPSEAASISKVNKVASTGSHSHEYIFPPFTGEIRCLYSAATNWEEFKSSNIRAVGPTGSGKSEFFRHLSREMFGNYYQINGHEDMDIAAVLGEKTLEVDEKSQQSYITYKKGILEKAMTHGLKKDADGNAELDSEGNVQILPGDAGKPALLFIDEFGAIPQQITIALNTLLEIPSAPGASRTLHLTSEGDRVVKSHPGFCIALSANTLGLGLTDEDELGYTAQDIQQDISTLNRITATYFFNYNEQIEKELLKRKVGDDTVVNNLCQFRDKIRNAKKEKLVERPFSTRDLVQLADVYRMFKLAGLNKPIGRALNRVIYSSLPNTEKASWKEAIGAVFAVDMDKDFD